MTGVQTCALPISVIPGYGSLHLADTALANVQLFGGRNPVVQTVAFTRASACLRVFGGVAGSVGGVSDAPVAGVRTAAAAEADPASAAGEPAPGRWPEAALPGKPSHEPSVIPMPAVSANASASRRTGSLRSLRSRAGRLPAARPA